MKKLVFFGLVLSVSSACAWEYRVIDNGQTVYAEGITPVDLSYPAAGQPTPVMTAGEPIQGQPISAQELEANLAKQHVIIIPEEKKLNRPRPTYRVPQ